MTTDICCAETGLTDPAARLEWDAMVRAFLAHGAAMPTHLGRVLELEPDSVLPLAARGLFCLMLARREMVGVAQTSANAAVAALAAGGAPPRARAWVAALQDWLAGSPGGAIFHLEGVMVQNPADTLTMKVIQGIRFLIGDAAGMRRSVERALAGHGTDHPLRGYVLGCHAFTLEETGDYAAAEAAGRAGLVLAADDAWGLHAVAHVHDMTQRPEMGIAFLDAHETAWSHCNNFRFHVWWHKALMYLDQGDHSRVLGLYDTCIRAEKTDDYRDLANATSLLARLALDGVAVGDRWAELADLAETRLTDSCLVFADLHYLLALTGANRADPARRLVGQMAGMGMAPTEQGRVAAHPGLAAAEGLAAFAEGRHARAFSKLQAARASMVAIGGSHAQRDVFDRITVDAGIRSGRFDAVTAILADRTKRRAGQADRFARTRSAQIADLQAVATSCAAE
jgi:hypothetical protein